ncbi:MAG: methyltransferase domain-containing protein [Patescibacteria group bacterium]
MDKRIDKIQNLFNERNCITWVDTYPDSQSPDELKRFEWFAKNTKLNLSKSSFFEIGVGSGTFYEFVKRKGIKEYLGSEPNKQMVERFEKYFPNQSEFIKENDALSVLKESNKKFDCIHISHVLEHLERDYFIDLFEAMVEKLNIDGEIWISTPCAETIIASAQRYYDMTHRTSFVFENFVNLAQLYNLQVIAKSGKLIAIENFKDIVRFTHEIILYWLNRILFAFAIGTRKKCGVFSSEISVILKK